METDGFESEFHFILSMNNKQSCLRQMTFQLAHENDISLYC